MHVLKVGGSILRERRDIDAVVRILQHSEGSERLLILSAFGQSTRLLDQACQTALRSEEDAYLVLERLLDDHKKMIELSVDRAETQQLVLSAMADFALRLRQFVKGIHITAQLSPRIRDKVLSFGEAMALHLFSAILSERGIAHATVDAETILVTNDEYGSAKPQRRETYQNVAKLLIPVLEKSGLVLMQGYVARSTSGYTTTMGRESSNLTAAIMANSLHAQDLTVYTDVDGIRSADPMVVHGTRKIESLSYARAYTMATAGMKLLYPTMIEPLRAARIPLRIRGLHHPDSVGTLIADGTGSSRQSAIIVIRALNLITVQARSLDADRDIRTIVLPALVENDHVIHSTRSGSVLNFTVTDDGLSGMKALLPEDCHVSHQNNIDLVRIIHDGSIGFALVAEVCKRDSFRASIHRLEWAEHDECITIHCAARISSELSGALHSACASS